MYRTWFIAGIAALGLLLDRGEAWAQAGYRIDRSSNQVIINTRDHWQNWEFPAGTIEISSAGQVEPRRWRKDTNAVFEIVDFLRSRPPEYLAKKKPEEITLSDAVQAGSNRADVVNVLDGDMSTYWEPDPPSSETNLASQWWFTVDLGQIVLIKKVVVRFVEEGQGDPFLLFDVLVSDGQKPIQALGGKSLDFLPILQTLQPNNSQRVFEIDLQGSGADVRQAVGRFVQVVVQGSALARGQEVSKEVYELLGPADAGLIEYTKRQPDGREIPVSQEVYEQLNAERQGSIRYFRRERPRLAELEVWGDGNEIVSGSLDRGGYFTTPGQLTPDVLFDGDVFSALSLDLATKRGFRVDEIFIDLGSFFWIDSQRMITNFRNSEHSSSLGNYQLDFSDGSRRVDGSLKWTTVKKIEQGSTGPTYLRGGGTPASGLLIDRNDFAPIKARFFRLAYEVKDIAGGGKGYLAEMQLFGSGFQPEVFLTSDLIRLGGSRNLISIEWDADTPPGTQVVMQTRTGNALETVVRYFRKDGTEVTEDQYQKLPKTVKGEIISKDVEGNDWSAWSTPYEEPTGSPITSPSPREFLKIRATLLSQDPDLRASLKAIRLHFADPVAQRLLGEITPTRVDSLGVERLFSLYLRPELAAGNLGFNELLLTAPASMSLGFRGLYAGKESDFLNEGGELSRLEVRGVTTIPTSADSLHLAFLAVQPGASIEVVRLDFTTTLFSIGGLLRAALRRAGKSEGEGFWQRVDPGDAMTQVTSNTMVVVAQPQSKELFKNMAIRPQVFTPNGDGINDEVVLDFSVVLVGGSSAVGVDIYDLSGRRVRSFAEQRAVSAGSYAIHWNGRDEGGNLVPPGVYTARLSLDADTKGAELARESVVRTIALTY